MNPSGNFRRSFDTITQHRTRGKQQICRIKEEGEEVKEKTRGEGGGEGGEEGEVKSRKVQKTPSYIMT